MRCPKCHYISFGNADRCRNCGYEFSLAADPSPVDLPIQGPEEPIGPMADLQLRDRPSAGVPHEPPPESRRSPAAARLDLPLFSDRSPADDAPLISAAGPPKPPLSVRRAPPTAPRARAERTLEEVRRSPYRHAEDRVPASEGGGPADAPLAVAAEGAGADVSASQLREQLFNRTRESAQRGRAVASPSAPLTEADVASAWARLFAGAVDVAILLGIDASVLYFTLRVLELPVAQVGMLPPVPIAVFLLLLNGGYLSIFTAAGGQTVGKMLTGIRVIPVRPDDDPGFDRYTSRVSMGAAVLRAAAYLISLLPAGLGFLAILFDKEGRALHDRLADTRVVKA